MLSIIEILSTLGPIFLALVGLYLANNYRRFIKQKISSARIVSYGRLWELTAVAAPMRKKAWHIGKGTGFLSLEERKELYAATTDWYFSEGNGMFLGNSTRNMYLIAKHNILCPDAELKPESLAKKVLEIPELEREKKRSELTTRQFSLLRHKMRVDLAVYGSSFFDSLNQEDRAFLKHCKEKWWADYWINSGNLEI